MKNPTAYPEKCLLCGAEKIGEYVCFDCVQKPYDIWRAAADKWDAEHQPPPLQVCTHCGGNGWEP